MQDIDTVEALRLQVLDNGFVPIRNFDKRTFMKGWPTAVVDAGEIARWSRRFSRHAATGIRVEDGLAVIDLDIDDAKMVAVISNRIYEEVPILGDPNVPLLVRFGKGSKEAWFVRTDEIFSRIHSRAWIKPGESTDDGAHRVEIFGGSSPRQFGSFGPHTVADDGDVATWYRWADRSPADTSKSELPTLTKQQFFLIADIVEQELAAAGWSVVEKSTSGENDVSRVYDLTEEMFFDLDTGDRVSLQQLRELAASAGEHTYRCSAAWLEGPSAKRTDRCLVSSTTSGGVAVHETSSGVTHCEASLKPRDFGPEIGAEINRLAERMKELDERRRNKVSVADGAVTAAAKMLSTYAFCKHQTANVVPIWATSMDAGVMLPQMRIEMLPNCDEEIGPRGGRIKINPVDLWASDERRVSVQGLRMRPDKPRPVYEDAEGKWINIYAPPIHDASGGSPEAGVALVEHLLPDEAERHWFTQWLAHKVRFPFVPGPAVIMVAREFGTGRGTLGALMGKLLGPQYVAMLQFHMFAGKSYQSQYDDWGADTLMAVISEASENNGASSFATKHDTYTHLKSLVEPRAMMRRYVSKRAHFKAMSFTSYFIATNDADALPIPANDRRFAVLSNGDNGTPEFWSWINAGLELDANIAAFHDYLTSYDLTGYNPYEAPPRTDAQQDMVDLGKSDLDQGLEIAFSKLVTPLYTPGQIVTLMNQAATEYDLNYPRDQWQSIAKRMAMKRGYRVGVRNGVNWHPIIGGVRSSVYATTKAVANEWKTSDRLREEVGRNNGKSTVESVGEKVVAIRGQLKK